MLPDVELPDDTGVMRRLSELRGDNALVLQLGRGEHCPRERQHHKELLQLQELIPVSFTTLVLAPGLVIDKVYCGCWFWGRPSVAQLWADLQDLFRRTKADFDPTTAGARAAWQPSQPPVAVPTARRKSRAAART